MDTQKSNTLSIVLGVVGIVISILGGILFGFIAALIGLGLGVVALILGINTKKATNQQTGNAGFILGLIALIFGAIFFIGCLACGACGCGSYGCNGIIGAGCQANSDLNSLSKDLNSLSSLFN